MERSNRLALLPSKIPILLISLITFLGNLIVFYLSNKLNFSFQSEDLINELTITTTNIYLSNNELLTKLLSSIVVRWSLFSCLISLISFIILLIKPSNTTIIRIFNLSSFLDFSINFLLIPILAFFSLHPIFSNQFSNNSCEILTRNEFLLGSTTNLKFASSRTSTSSAEDLIILNNDLERVGGNLNNNNYYSNGFNGSNSWGIESCEETWWKVIFLTILFLTGLVLIRGMMLGITMDYVSRVELIMRDISGTDGEEKGNYKNLPGGSDEKVSSSSSSSTRRLGRASTLPTGRSSSRNLGRYKSNTISHPSNPSTSPSRTVLVPIFYEPKSQAPSPSSSNPSSSYYETAIPQSKYLPSLFPQQQTGRRFSASSTTSSTASSSTRSSLRHFQKSNLLPTQISNSQELIPIHNELVEEDMEMKDVLKEEEEEGDEFDKSL